MISALKTILNKITKQVDNANKVIEQYDEQSSDELEQNYTESTISSSTLNLVEESIIDFDNQPFIPKSYLLRNESLPSSPLSSDSNDDSSQEIEMFQGHISLDESQIEYASFHNISRIENEDLQTEQQSTFYDDESYIKTIPKYHGSIQFTPKKESLIKTQKLKYDINKKKQEIASKNSKKNSDILKIESPSSASKTVQFGPKLLKNNENDMDLISVPIKTILKKNESPNNNHSNLQRQNETDTTIKMKNKSSNDHNHKTTPKFEDSFVTKPSENPNSVSLSNSSLNININLNLNCNNSDCTDNLNNDTSKYYETNLHLENNCPNNYFNSYLQKNNNNFHEEHFEKRKSTIYKATLEDQTNFNNDSYDFINFANNDRQPLSSKFQTNKTKHSSNEQKSNFINKRYAHDNDFYSPDD